MNVDCTWVADRLVALHDAELSPSETHFVLEHLEGCEACAALEAALLEATPEPCLVVPPEIQARLEAAVDEAIARTLAEPPPARAPLATPWTRWLRRDRSLSNAAALAYGFVLAACLGWGLSNWMSLHELEAEVARTELRVPADPQTSLAPDQYRPASFSEDESPEPWR